MLAAGSANTDVTAELVWVGRGTLPEIEAAKVEGKIAVTEGGLGQRVQHRLQPEGRPGRRRRSPCPGRTSTRSRCPGRRSAAGGGWAAVSAAASRVRRPGGQRAGQPPAAQQPPAQAAPQTPPPAPKFAFQIPVREGDYLKQRLMANQKITVHAVVQSKQEKYTNNNTLAFIPGTDPNAGEVILSAHLFEGMVKQGANDNNSGSATILEVARILNTLIGDGRLPKPKRGIRFIWGPEISGIGIWVKANKAIMDRTLCNINMDMVGEYLSKNQAFFCLMRTTFGNAHYINDVMENYYRYVGEGNRERIQIRGGFDKVPVRIVAPFGADEPFYYSIETHYGASDHEVFNDWGVKVPGIMMIAWPDRWYHTTEDLPDKSDATQLKRAAAIGAAGAYTVANADDAMAMKIAAEIASNATRRIGHYLVAGLEALNGAEAEKLEEAYRNARAYVEGGAINEKDTLDSILQLAADKAGVGRVPGQAEEVRGRRRPRRTSLALEARMEIVAKSLGVEADRPGPDRCGEEGDEGRPEADGEAHGRRPPGLPGRPHRGPAGSPDEISVRRERGEHGRAEPPHQRQAQRPRHQEAPRRAEPAEIDGRGDHELSPGPQGRRSGRILIGGRGTRFPISYDVFCHYIWGTQYCVPT